MDFSALIGCGIVMCFLLFSCAFLVQRLRWKRSKRFGRKGLGFYPTFSSLGQSLQRLQQIAQPHVVISMLEENKTEDEEGEEEIEKDGVQHLHRQLKRVRSGDGLERLTVLLRLWRP